MRKHTAEGAALFRPTGFEHAPIILWRNTSLLTKLANYANQVIGYALADAALKNGSKSSCTKVHSGFCELGGNGKPPIPAKPTSPFFALP